MVVSKHHAYDLKKKQVKPSVALLLHARGALLWLKLTVSHRALQSCKSLRAKGSFALHLA